MFRYEISASVLCHYQCNVPADCGLCALLRLGDSVSTHVKVLRCDAGGSIEKA